MWSFTSIESQRMRRSQIFYNDTVSLRSITEQTDFILKVLIEELEDTFLRCRRSLCPYLVHVRENVAGIRSRIRILAILNGKHDDEVARFRSRTDWRTELLHQCSPYRTVIAIPTGSVRIEIDFCRRPICHQGRTIRVSYTVIYLANCHEKLNTGTVLIPRRRSSRWSGRRCRWNWRYWRWRLTRL